MRIKLREGSTVNLGLYNGPKGELVLETDTGKLRAQGTATGGVPIKGREPVQFISAPSVIEPKDKSYLSTGLPLIPTQYKGSGTPSEIRWQISTNNTFTAVIYDNTLNYYGDLYIPDNLTAFVNNQPYYVRCKYLNTEGIESDWSAYATFTGRDVDAINLLQSIYDPGEAKDGATNASDVAISGDGMVLALSNPNDSAAGYKLGSVKIYFRENGKWVYKQIVGPTDNASPILFGTSVALSLDGTYLVVGMDPITTGSSMFPGAVYRYKFNGSAYIVVNKLTPSNPSVTGNASRFGRDISMSDAGRVLVIGQYYAEDILTGAGKAKVYEFDVNDGIINTSQLKASNTTAWDYLGSKVSVSGNGNVIALGAPNRDDNSVMNTGAVYIYNQPWGSDKTEDVYITASDKSALDFFGTAVSLDAVGDKLVISAQQDGLQSRPGKVYYYTETGGVWTERSIIQRPAGYLFISMGNNLTMSKDSNYMVIATRNTTTLPSRMVYKRTGYVWAQVASPLSSPFYYADINNDGSLIVGAIPHGYKQPGVEVIG